MSEDTKNNNTMTLSKSVSTLPDLIKDPKYYQLLISHRGTSFRKSMISKLDSVFTPPLGFNAWKNRFLYPEKNIPKKEIKEIAIAMEEALAFELQAQQDFIRNEINIKLIEITDLRKSLKNLENILEQTQIAVKIYRDDKKI